MRLDQRLRADRPDLSWRRIREAIGGGQVLVDGVTTRDPGLAVSPRAAIEFDPSRKRLPRARLELPTLYEDDEILVVDKPAGLLTIPSTTGSRGTEDTVLDRVRTYAMHLNGPRAYVGMLHRLDRDTSGALAVALSRDAHREGRALFGQHAFERWYLALIHGVPARAEDTIDRPVSNTYADGRRQLVRDERRGRRAVTHYRVREAFGDAALVELQLDTGRQHQIRLHFQHLGHSLIGERVYVDSERGPQARRQMLHAWRLAFPHPMSGQMIEVTAPIPRDMAQLCERLRRKRP